MSKLQHTPGPWGKCHANDDKCPCGLIWDNTGYFVIASVTSTCKEHESSNLSEGMNRGSNEFLANARLITAAPEMLIELLKSIAELDKTGFASITSETIIMKATGWSYDILNDVLTKLSTGMSIEEILK